MIERSARSRYSGRLYAITTTAIDCGSSVPGPADATLSADDADVSASCRSSAGVVALPTATGAREACPSGAEATAVRSSARSSMWASAAGLPCLPSRFSAAS